MREVTTTPEAPSPDPLEAGRAALARHAWIEAFDRLTEADRTTPLAAADLDALALAAFFAARPEARSR